MRNDDRMDAWVYFYNGSVDQLKAIPGGDYRNKLSNEQVKADSI
jgi:gamma-glutamylcyclotransferase (GGCT)/AIG2-like uncharacterized protein YtfP